MAKIKGSDVAFAAFFVATGAFGTLVTQMAYQSLNGEYVPPFPTALGDMSAFQPIIDHKNNPPPQFSLAFAGSTEAKQAQEADALAQQHLNEQARLIKAENEAVFAAQIKPLLDVITAIPATDMGEQFVVKALNTAKSARYEVGYTAVFVVKEPMTRLYPKVTQISHDPDTNTYVYHEVQSGLKQQPFIINVGEDGFSIETSNGFTMDKQNYATVEELYVAIGEEVRILAPNRLGELSLLEQGQQPVNTASAAPAPAPALGM